MTEGSPTDFPDGTYRITARDLAGRLATTHYHGAAAFEDAQDVELDSLGGHSDWPNLMMPMTWGTAAIGPRATRVRGKARVGRTLRVSRGTWTPSTVTLRYRWFRKTRSGFEPIPGARSRTLSLRKKLRGDRVRVRVRAVALGHAPRLWTSRCPPDPTLTSHPSHLI